MFDFKRKYVYTKKQFLWNYNSFFGLDLFKLSGPLCKNPFHSQSVFTRFWLFSFFKKCLSDNNFAKENDQCIRNPGYCSNGLSFSLFYWPDYKELDAELAVPNLAGNFEKEYILSSGGDFGIPGIAIYRQGGTFGALVSTGNQTWIIEVVSCLGLFSSQKNTL